MNVNGARFVTTRTQVARLMDASTAYFEPATPGTEKLNRPPDITGLTKTSGGADAVAGTRCVTRRVTGRATGRATGRVGI